jgi:hypothetical protein
MLLHQSAAALKVYLQYENVQDDGLGQSWQTTVLNDFTAIRSVLGDMALIDEVTADFASKQSSRNPERAGPQPDSPG